MERESRGGQRHCIYCKTDQTWVFSGLKLKDGSKVYFDENGARWAGKRCPKCEKKRVQAAVKYDQFERNNIVEELEKTGYSVLNTTSPLQIQKDGIKQTVAIRRAYTKEDGTIVVESASKNEQNTDMTALLFQTVKLCSQEMMMRLEDKFEVYEKKDERSRRRRKAPTVSTINN